MIRTRTPDLGGPDRAAALLGAAAVALLLASSVVGVALGAWKLLAVAWVAFGAMVGGALAGARHPGSDAETLVWGYGIASGAMLTSAALFLLPQSIGVGGRYGGVGVALGLLVGFGAHTAGHRLSHLDLPGDRTVVQLTAHAAAAGTIIGVVYGNMPELGPLLGMAIVSHKGPAGYAAADRLRRSGGDVVVLLVPAAGVGVAAILSSLLALPPSAPVRGIVFGFATGVFIHVAMDFLPHCEVGSEVHEALGAAGDDHDLLDRLRTQAVLSTGTGGLAVFLGWIIVTA